MSVIQNFSAPAGDDLEIVFVFDPGYAVAEDGAVVEWKVYDQSVGIPDLSEPILSKSTSDGIDFPPSPGTEFTVRLNSADTVDLLGNYYHEAKVTDINGDLSTVTTGIMTVTQTGSF